jgi:hypothetical protein
VQKSWTQLLFLPAPQNLFDPLQIDDLGRYLQDIQRPCQLGCEAEQATQLCANEL